MFTDMTDGVFRRIKWGTRIQLPCLISASGAPENKRAEVWTIWFWLDSSAQPVALYTLISNRALFCLSLWTQQAQVTQLNLDSALNPSSVGAVCGHERRPRSSVGAGPCTRVPQWHLVGGFETKDLLHGATSWTTRLPSACAYTPKNYISDLAVKDNWGSEN